jgi:PAS domain S-box-containing protein
MDDEGANREEVSVKVRPVNSIPREQGKDEGCYRLAYEHDGVNADVTDQRRTEEVLKETEERYRELFENMKEACYVAEPVFDAAGRPCDCRYIDANPAFAALGGLPVDAIRGRLDSDLFSSSEPLWFESMARVAETGKAENFESRSPRTGRWFNGSAYSPRKGLAAIILSDITESKLALEALQQSEEKYKNLFSIEGDALFLMDQDTRLILEVNNAACLLYGYSSEEMLQKRGTDLSAEPEESEQSFQQRRTRIMVRFHKKKDGTRFPVDISATDFNFNGRRVVLAAVRDISDHVAAEEELKQYRQHLEALVRARTKELGAKAKEVRELNIALKVLLKQVREDKDRLEQRFAENVNKLVLPYLEKIKKQGHLDEREKSYLGIVETNLSEIMSPLVHNMRLLNLSPREVQVATLIRDGKSTKEIAEVIGVAPDAVDSYRGAIRHKLGLNKQKVNLQAYLQSLK